jgi:hypothetical protein
VTINGWLAGGGGDNFAHSVVNGCGVHNLRIVNAGLNPMIVSAVCTTPL